MSIIIKILQIIGFVLFVVFALGFFGMWIEQSFKAEKREDWIDEKMKEEGVKK